MLRRTGKMTNEEIIMNERFRLMESGIIGTTGKTVTITDKNGPKKSLPEPEDIHTYSGWRERGFQVKRGEHAVTRIRIWKHIARKLKDEDKEPKERMIATTACFFKNSQVEPMERGADDES